MTNRLIGSFTGIGNDVLIVAIAAIHGNEPAGVLALRDLFDMLEHEVTQQPHFQFKGRMIGIVGNIQAYERRIRFVKKDLNRSLTLTHIQQAQSIVPDQRAFEDLEMIELIDLIKQELISFQPQKLIVLDLHTTSALGGIFTIVADDTEAIQLASQLFAPVVKGLVKDTGGSTLHYFTQTNMGIPTLSLAFEGGQHQEVAAVRRITAWLINCLRAVGCVSTHNVEYRHEAILRGYAKGLPKVVEIIGHHRILSHDNFKMVEGYHNFQSVKQGEVLAYDNSGAIRAPENCMILMPLYQKQGSDGFFLVKAVEA